MWKSNFLVFVNCVWRNSQSPALFDHLNLFSGRTENKPQLEAQKIPDFYVSVRPETDKNECWCEQMRKWKIRFIETKHMSPVEYIHVYTTCYPPNTHIHIFVHPEIFNFEMQAILFNRIFLPKKQNCLMHGVINIFVVHCSVYSYCAFIFIQF